MKSNFRVWFIALLGTMVFGVTETYAGTAYTNGRAFLKQGSPTGGGKVYVASNGTTPSDSQYKAVTSSTSPAFNVEVAGNATFHYWAKANAGYIFTGWYDENGNLVSSGAAHISKAMTAGTAGTSDTHAYADYYASFIKQIQLSFITPTNGSFTISHNGSTVTPAYSSFTVEGKVVLTALPADGYKLRGWYTTTNGGTTKNYFAFGNSCEPNFTGNATIGAEFVPDDGKATFWIKGTNKIYDDLGTANTNASSGNVIVVVSDGVVGSGTYSIKAGVTLLIPYDETYNLMTKPTIKHIPTPSASSKITSIFRKLTLAPGATINVSGNICIGGSIASCNGGSPSSFPTGPVGMLDLSRGGTINLNGGSNLYAWGYVKGQDMDQGNNTAASGVGQINAASGATVWEDYQVGEWRGGTASSTIYNNKSSWKFFPFQSYSVQNVEAPVTYAYGSNCKCYWTIFGNGSVYDVTFPLIASSGSLFQLKSGGTVKKWYDPTTDHVCFEMGGTAALDALTLTVMGETVSSSDYYLPIPANLKISLKSGNTLTVSKPMTMHAGSVVEVQSGATLNVNDKVFLYDADDWDTYCMYAYYYRTYYSPSLHFDRGEGTAKTNLEDATVIVDGTINVAAQKLYATAHGANICGNGGGTFVYNTLPGNTTMTQCKTLCDNVSVNIRSANLHNDNGSYTKGIASTTFKNVNGRWFKQAASTEKSNHTYDFTYIKSGDVYGTGGTNATVSACWTKDKTGVKLQDKWANIQAEGCTNWWEGIDDTHLYNWSLNSAWHQYIMTGSTTIIDEDEEEVTTETYAGSDGKLLYKTDCNIVNAGSIDGECLYTVDDVKKALVNGSFIAVTANTSPDHGYHDASTNYYLCFEGCVWHPATRNAENLYTVSGTKYIWYGDQWMAVQYDSGVSLYYSLSSTNVKIYYEYVDHAWVLATPVAEVVTSAGTEQVFSLANAITKAKSGGTNVTIRLMKNLSGSFTYDGENNCGLDLNGFTFSSSSSSMIKANNAKATIIIKDQSTSGTGKVYVKYSRSDDKIYGLNVTNGHIVLNSGTVHIENTHASQGACGVYVVSGMKFTMNGGTLEVVSNGASWGVYTLSSTTSLVTINGGTIDASTASASGDNTTCAIYGLGGDITVNGGTLNGTASATYARGIYLNSANPKLTINGGTITATAPNTIYGLHLIAGAAATVNGGTITATATGGTVRGILSYGTLTMNGGTVNANAGGSDSRGLFLRNNTSTIKSGASVNVTATTNAYGIYYDNATPTVTVDGGTFTVNTTSTTGAYGVYAAKGTGTINDGTFTVTAKTTGAEGLHVESTNTPKLTVNGGKYMVKNSDGAANGVVNNTAAAAANFSLAGGYYNLAPAGSYVASGKSVQDIDCAKEAAICSAGYVKKIRGNEYTVTWKHNNGTTVLGTTLVESGKVPVWTGEAPDPSTSTTTRRWVGWCTEKSNKGDKYPLGTDLPTITDHDTTYYVYYQNIYAEVTIGTETTRYANAKSAWDAAMGAQRATIRLLSNLGTESSIGNMTQMVFNPTNANSIITLDLNGRSWTMGANTDPAKNTSPFLQVNKAGCKLIITDNSASANGYLMNSWAKTDGDLRCVEVNAGELVLQKGGIKVKNTDADHYSHAVVVSGNNAHFTMTGGTVYATDGKSPRGVNVANGYGDIAGGTVEAYSTTNEAYALLSYDTVTVSEGATIRATGTTGSSYATFCYGAAAVLNIDSAILISNAYQTARAMFAQNGGKITVDGKSSISATTTTGSGAYATYATGANSKITINDGTYTVTSVANSAYGAYAISQGKVIVNGGSFAVTATGNAARGVYAENNGVDSIRGGSFTVTSNLDGDASSFGAYAAGGTVNIDGGTFTLNVVKVDQNADLVRCGTGASYLNVSGGTFTTTNGRNCVRSFGGVTNITGNPVFTARRGIDAGSWASAAGTAQITVDGGTYNCTNGSAILSTTHTHATNGTVIGDVTILDGKFHTTSSIKPIHTNSRPAYLKIKGGYYTSYTASDISKNALDSFVIAPSYTTALETTDPMYLSPNDYRYRVNTKYTATWKDMAGNTIKTDEWNRNETPSYGSDYVPSDGNTYTFNGWLPTPGPIQSDQVYTAQYTKWEAEVYEGENPTPVRFQYFTDAFREAQNLPVARIKVISNVYYGTSLTLNPTEAAGSKPLTIDLNNHIVNYTKTDATKALTINKAGCKLIIDDSSLAKGGQFGHRTTAANGSAINAIYIQNGELELAGGTIIAQNNNIDASTDNSKGTRAVTGNTGTVFTMTGGKLYAKSRFDARCFNSDGAATFNATGGTIEATNEYTDGGTQWGTNAYGVVLWNYGTFNMSGTASMTVTAASGALGVYPYGGGGSGYPVTNISGGSINCLTKTGGASRAVQTYGSHATTNISGGDFTVNAPAGQYNVEDVTCQGGATVNITGGNFHSTTGANCVGVRVFNGTATIDGTAFFDSRHGIVVGDWAEADGVTATAYVNGGTFDCPEYVLFAKTTTNDAKTVTGTMYVNGGYFKTASGHYICGTSSGTSNLILHGGYYNETSGTTQKDNITTYKGATTEVSTLSPAITVEGRTYHYQLLTDFDITWLGGDSYNKVEQLQSGTDASNTDLDGTYFLRNDSAFYFTHWSPTPSTVIGDATYNAVGVYQAAKVTVAAQDSIFDDFDEAWAYAMAQDEATITLLSNIARTSYILYKPASADAHHTLDLNNFTISNAGTDAYVLRLKRAGAQLTITDNSTEKGGKLQNHVDYAGTSYAVAVSSGDLMIAGGEISARNSTSGKKTYGVNVGIDGSTFTMTGGTLKACSYGVRAINTSKACTINISGGHIIATTELEEDTWLNTAYGLYCSGASTVTISGSPIIDVDADYYAYGIIPSGTSDVKVNGGTFNVTAHTRYAYGIYANATSTVTINNGIFNATAPKTIYGAVAKANSSVTINGGYFKTSRSNIVFQDENDGETITATMTIKGGYFNEYSGTYHKDEIDAFVTSPYEIYEIESSDPNYPEYSYCVTNGHPVASVQTGAVVTHYTTIKAALDYAKTQNNSVTTLLEDCDFETEEQWGYGLCPTGKTMTIDLNNHTLNATNTVASYDRVFNVSGQLTITDNSDSKGGKMSLMKNFDGSFIGVVINASGKLTLANGTVYVENEHATKGVCGVNVWGTGGNYTQTGGLLEVKANGGANGLTHRQSVTLSGGEIRVTSVNSSASGDAPSATAAEGLYGSTTVSGTASINVTAKNDARAFTCTVAGTTTTISGGTFRATATNGTSARCIHATAANTITVSGGKFFAGGDKIVDVTSATLTITGGYFNEKSGTTYKSQINPYVSSPYEIYEIEASDPNYPDYSYCIMNGHPVASVQTGAVVTHYTTIKAALDYAKTVADPTISLLDDCTLDQGNYPINPGTTWTCTLNLNNHTLTPTVDATWGRAFSIGGTGTKFIVTDNSVGQGGQIYYKGNSSLPIIYFVMGANAEMELAGGTLYVENTNASTKAIGFVVDHATASFTQSGGTFTIKGAYGANGYYGGGTATFTGGTMNVDGGAYQAIGLFPQVSTSVLNVSGTFALNVTSSLADSYGVLVKNSGATGTISGGKFKFNQNTMVGAQLDANLTINGGYFCEHPSEAGRYKSQINPLKGSGKEVVNLSAGDPEYEDGYRYIVTDADQVAKITTESTTTYYTTIADAIEAANEMTNPTVTMLQNDTVASEMSITAAMTIDLNDKTIANTQTGSSKAVFRINASGEEVTIQDSGSDGTIYRKASSSGALYGIYVTAGTLNITGGTVYAENQNTAKTSYGIVVSDALNMTGGTVNVKGEDRVSGIYTNAATASATLENVTLTTTANDSASYALFAYAGGITVNSGTYTAKGAKNTYAIYSQNATSVSVIVNGGKFSGKTYELRKGSKATVSIRGGYYVHNTTVKDNLAANHYMFSETLTEGGITYNYRVAEKYTLAWSTDGDDLTGTYTSGLTEVGTTITAPNTPTKTGYTFAAWSPAFTGTMPAANTTYTATWTPNTNTAYTVKHYKQNLAGDGYDLADTDNLTGTTATSVTPAVKSYEGFTAPSTQTVTILADGSRVVTYNYTRNSYTLAWALDGGEISEAGTTAGSVKYGAALTAPTVTKAGYVFNAWSPSVPATMPAANSTYTATWTAAEAEVTINGVTTPYLKFYDTGAMGEAWYAANASRFNPATIKLLQDVEVNEQLTYDNGFDQNCTLDLNGHTITSATAVQSPLTIDNADITFTITDGTVGKAGKLSMTTTYSGGDIYSVLVNAGALVLNGGTMEVTANRQTNGIWVKTGAAFTMHDGTLHVKTTNSKRGRGVYVDGGTATIDGGEIFMETANNGTAIYYNSGTGAVTVTGGKIKIITSGSKYVTYGSNKNISISGGYYNYSNSHLTDYLADSYHVFDVDPALDGIYTYEVAEGYTLTWTTDGDALTGTYTSGTTKVGTTITAPNTPTKTGYTFNAWSPAVAETMPSANTTYTATWTPNTNTVTFDKEGGSEGDNSVTATYAAAMPTVTPPTRENYEFGGYWDGDNGTGNQYYNADGTSARTWNKTSNTTLYAKWTDAVASVTINSGTPSYHATLAGAFNTAKDAAKNATTVITVLKDITDITSQITYSPENKCTTTLNLNGHTVQGAVTTDNQQLIRFSKAGAILEITDSGTGGKLHNEASLNNSLYCIYVDNGHLKISGGTVSVKNTLAYNSSTAKSVKSYAIYTRSNATASNVQITMTNGTVKAEGDYCVYALCPRCTANISGGKIEAEASTGYAYAIFSNSPGGSATTISGTVEVSAEAPTYAGSIYSYGTTNVEGGTFTATATTGSYAYGIRVPRGTTTATNNPSFTVTAKTYAYGVYAGEKTTSDATLNNGHAIIRGGTFTVSTTKPETSGYTYAYGVYGHAEGRTVSEVGYVSEGTIDVYGGTFDVSAYYRVYGIYSKGTVTQLEESKAPKINIYGGKFKVTKGATSSTTNWGAVCPTSATVTNTDVVIEGGYFNTNVNNYLDQYTAPTRDCDYEVKPTPAAIKAIIGNEYTYMVTNENAVAIVTGDASESYYALTVADAVDAAKDMTNPTVLMLQDASSTEEVEIKAAMTIDLNGMTISSTQTDNAKGVFKINASGKTVTLRDSGTGGKIDHTATISGGSAVGIYVAAGSLRMESGIVYAKNPSTTNSSQAFGIATASSCGLTMTGGTVTAEAYKEARGLWLNGTTSLTDATVTSTSTNNISYAVQANAGALTVHSGTYTATGSTGYAVREVNGTVSIEGGRFNGSTQDFFKAGGTASISGGYYVHNTDLAANCATNYSVKELTSAEKAVIGGDYNYQVTNEGGNSGPLDIVDYSATSVTLNMNGYTSVASKADWKVLAYGNTYTKTNRAADRTLVVDISSASLSADDTIRIDGTASDGTTVESHYMYIMPHIFTSKTTLDPASVKATSVLYVKSDTLTIDANTRVNKVYVCADAALIIEEGATLTVDTLFLRTKPFHSAEMINNGTLAATKVYYTRQIASKTTYYEIALPFDVTLANVRFSNGKPATYGTHYGLMEYSGQSRADNGPNTSLNWKTLDPSKVTKMNGKQAYEMISASAYYYEFYFPVTYTKRADGATVAVTAYARAEGDTPKGDKGWNFITTPFTHAFECDYGENPEDGLKIAWRAEDNTSFNQDVVASIKPTQPFYYQTETTGNLVFKAEDFHFAAMPRRAAQRLSTQWIRLHYGAEGASSDVANIYLNDEKFTSAYETGYDVAKWSLDGGKPLIWTVVGSDKLAFAALPDSVAANSIPVTVFNPTEGAFTFSLEQNRYMKRLENVYLWDTYMNTTVDLMTQDYTEFLETGTIEGRFYLYTRNVQSVPTAIDLIGDGAEADNMKPRKVMIDGKVFIIRGAHVYSIDGHQVK